MCSLRGEPNILLELCMDHGPLSLQAQVVMQALQQQLAADQRQLQDDEAENEQATSITAKGASQSDTAIGPSWTPCGAGAGGGGAGAKESMIPTVGVSAVAAASMSACGCSTRHQLAVAVHVCEASCTSQGVGNGGPHAGQAAAPPASPLSSSPAAAAVRQVALVLKVPFRLVHRLLQVRHATHPGPCIPTACFSGEADAWL